MLWLSGCGSSAAPKQPAMAPTPSQASASARGAPPNESDENRFYSPVAGLSIEKRPNWAFVTLEMELANREAVSVGKQETDAVMHDGTTPPLVAISRYQEPSEKPNPSLKITLRALLELTGASAVEIARSVTETLKQAIPSFQLDSEIRAAQVDGLAAGTFHAHFTVDVPRLQRSFPVTTQAWIVPRGKYAFIIAASDPSGGTENYEADFQAMVATIKIRK